MRRLLPVAALLLSACGDVYVLSEAEGVSAAKEELAAHGISAIASDHALGPVIVDGVPVSFVLDGWSAEPPVGLEYVAERDPDFSEAPSDLGSVAGSARLQAAVDTSVPATTHVLVLRTWGHETFELAEAQLRRRVAEWVDALGR